LANEILISLAREGSFIRLLLNVGAVRAGSQTGFPITKKWPKDKHLAFKSDLYSTGHLNKRMSCNHRERQREGTKEHPKMELYEENKITKLPRTRLPDAAAAP